MSEREFQRRLLEILADCGAETFNVHGHAFQARGWPDLHVAHRTWTGWIELKVGANAATPLQREVIRRLRERGTSALVLRLRGRLLTPEACGWDSPPPSMAWPCGGMALLNWLALEVDP